MFDTEFMEPQEALGISVIGQFRNLDDPNTFVWLRGFPSMEMRAKALSGFYDGALWKSRRKAANATIIDNDNVLLLRRVNERSGFALDALERPDVGAKGNGSGMIVCTIYHLDPTLEGSRAADAPSRTVGAVAAARLTMRRAIAISDCACASSRSARHTSPPLRIRSSGWQSSRSA
jgi:hypothetical protein